MHDPICNHDHPDCFAKKNGKCVCLNDTKFGGVETVPSINRKNNSIVRMRRV